MVKCSSLALYVSDFEHAGGLLVNQLCDHLNPILFYILKCTGNFHNIKLYIILFTLQNNNMQIIKMKQNHSYYICATVVSLLTLV